MTTKRKLMIICGGPSGERGISLNSARSLYDNLDKDLFDVSIIYFNTKLDAFRITPRQIYSNTPLDFDYLLKRSRAKMTRKEFLQFLKKMHVVFPAIHGTFGEDGQLQKILESARAKYIGSGPQACEVTNNKHACSAFLKKHGYFQMPNFSVKKGGSLPKLPRGRYVVKPQNGGSSIGVFIVQSQAQLEDKIRKVFEIDENAIIEPFCEGREFTLIVLENADGKPVSLVPTEIEFTGDTLFDYRKKYLATGDTRYHTPARFPQKMMDKIREQAQEIFALLKMKDMARLDGWVMPDGQIWFSDINAISGMEQNSFLFQQPAMLGMSHRQTLQYILDKKIYPEKASKKRKDIPVIFGGTSAERQVSVMSGTNVWVKLKSSKKYRPIPYFFAGKWKFFSVPHFICLHHTAEEIHERIEQFQDIKYLDSLRKWQKEILPQLGIDPYEVDEKLFVPEAFSVEALAKKYDFFFLGLHGSPGEDGTFQRKLDQLRVHYNGPGADSSRLCIDKYLTGKVVEAARIPGVRTAKKIVINANDNAYEIWEKLMKKGFPTSVIVKPRDDGCSAGVLRLHSAEHLEKYLKFWKGSFSAIPSQAIHHAHGMVELPYDKPEQLLVEEFIETDKVVLHNLEIEWRQRTGWIEVTCGVFGRKGRLQVFQPSQTVADMDVLSLEEKFMGGTGVNFTPPPAKYVSRSAVERVRENLKKVADALEIGSYSRFDLFIQRKTGEMIVIEANTLPALTPSTVLFHQALSEKNPLFPMEFLERLIQISS